MRKKKHGTSAAASAREKKNTERQLWRVAAKKKTRHVNSGQHVRNKKHGTSLLPHPKMKKHDVMFFGTDPEALAAIHAFASTILQKSLAPLGIY